MTRWVTESNYITSDMDRLQRVIIHNEASNKETHKAELRGYSYKRFCLIGRKHEDSVSYHCK